MRALPNAFQPPLPALKADIGFWIKRYKRDVVIKVTGMYHDVKRQPGGVRGEITQFSFSSSQRLEFLIRNSPEDFKYFLTLTYPAAFPNDGRVVKRDLHTFLRWVQRMNECEKEPGVKWNIRYVWVLEFQERGAPHIHLLVTDWPRWCNPLNGMPCAPDDVFRSRGRNLKAVPANKMLSRRWYRTVGSRDPKHLLAGTQLKAVKYQEGLPSYMGGYLKKSHQKEIPKGFSRAGRFWGANVRAVGKVMQTVCTYAQLGKFVRPMRRWIVARYRALSLHRWEWQGLGFTIREGAALFDALFVAGVFRSAIAAGGAV